MPRPSSEPVTSEPVTSAPVTSAPVTSAPVTSAPVTSATVTSEAVPTPSGEARVWWHPAHGRVRALLVLGHGAGRGVDTLDLQALAAVLPSTGIGVVLVDQPWVVAGRKVAVPPPQLDLAWRAVVPGLRDRVPARVPLLLGGRSAGARVACRTASALGAAGVVALAFPLHPPGRPERSRVDELASCGVPALVLQGERDTFGGPEDVRRALEATTVHPAPVRVVPVPYADHGLKVAASAPVTRQETLALLVEAVEEWVTDLVATPR